MIGFKFFEIIEGRKVFSNARSQVGRFCCWCFYRSTFSSHSFWIVSGITCSFSHNDRIQYPGLPPIVKMHGGALLAQCELNESVL
jgi:hypothetical protein